MRIRKFNEKIDVSNVEMKMLYYNVSEDFEYYTWEFVEDKNWGFQNTVEGEWIKKSMPSGLDKQKQHDWYKNSNREDSLFIQNEQEYFEKYVEKYREELQAHEDEIRLAVKYDNKKLG